MANAVKPITPGEVAAGRDASIPDKMLEAFNECICKSWSERSAVVYQDDVVAAAVEKGLKAQEIYDNNWLDVEGIYRAAGWKVEYDKPDYTESHRANFTFSKARR